MFPGFSRCPPQGECDNALGRRRGGQGSASTLAYLNVLPTTRTAHRGALSVSSLARSAPSVAQPQLRTPSRKSEREPFGRRPDANCLMFGAAVCARLPPIRHVCASFQSVGEHHDEDCLSMERLLRAGGQCRRCSHISWWCCLSFLWRVERGGQK